MHTANMVGPAGPNGCSVMTCMNGAVVEKLYEVTHPYQESRKIRYRFCTKHKYHGFEYKPHDYPNYELIGGQSVTE